jgi:hypothetical protein
MTNPVTNLLQAAAEFVTPVTLVTGRDAKGNDFAYTKSDGEWLDIWRECIVGKSYIDTFVIPNVTLARFGDVELTRAEWVALDCPPYLNRRQLEQIENERKAIPVDVVGLVRRDITRKVMVTE